MKGHCSAASPVHCWGCRAAIGPARNTGAAFGNGCGKVERLPCPGITPLGADVPVQRGGCAPAMPGLTWKGSVLRADVTVEFSWLFGQKVLLSLPVSAAGSCAALQRVRGVWGKIVV